MQGHSILFDQYAAQLNNPNRSSEIISPVCTSIDPRFNSLLFRPSIFQERVKQEQDSSKNFLHSPSIVTNNSNAWSPTVISEEKPAVKEKKTCLSQTGKNRLQGLLVGLAIAVISIAIILAVLLTRPSANSPTTVVAVTITAAAECSSLKWSESSENVAGNGTYGNASYQFANAIGLYIDANYVIYVADQSNHRVQQWLPRATDGTTVAGVTGVPGSNDSLLNYPRALYGDSQQNLYISDNYGIIIWPIGASVGRRIASSTTIGSIYALYVDKKGYIYASSFSNCVIQMWTSTNASGTIVAGGNGCGYGSSQLYSPYGITVDSSTNIIYIANFHGHTVVAWPIGSGNGTIIAGRNSTYGTTDFLLRNPIDIQQDPYGNLYVADYGNNRVLLFCQNPSNTNAKIIAGYQLSNPYRIALDSALNLYVLTYNRVQKYTRIV